MASILIVIAQLVVYCVTGKQTGKKEGTSCCRIEGRPPDSQACTAKNKGTADFFPLGNTSTQ